MKEIIDTGRTVILPSGRQGFNDANKVRVFDVWLNAVQEEIVNAIDAAGITPDNAQVNQLAQAIQAIATSTAGTALNGYATQSWVSGIVNNYIPTSAKNQASGVLGLDANAKANLNYLYFQQDGVGSIQRDAQEKARETLTPQDFGAVGDGVADDTAALQLTIDEAMASGKSIYVPAGTYKITSTLIKPQSFHAPNIFGDGWQKTVFDYSSAPANTTCLRIIGGSGALSLTALSSIRFEGNATSIAVEVIGQCGYDIDSCRFGTNAVGVLLSNDVAAGTFTEFIKIKRCNILPSCVVPFEMFKGAGDESFHGCGITDDTIIVTNTPNANLVKIGAGCYWYNGVLDCTVFTESLATNAVLVQSNSTRPPSALAKIRVENQGGNLIIGSGAGSAITLVGNMVVGSGYTGVNGYSVRNGSALFCEQVSYDASGSPQTVASRANIKSALAVSPITIIGSRPETVRLAVVHITKSNYEYRAVVLVYPQGFGGAGNATVLQNWLLNNTDPLGAPTFSVNSAGYLVITNPNYTGNVNCMTTYNQISFGINQPAAVFN